MPRIVGMMEELGQVPVMKVKPSVMGTKPAAAGPMMVPRPSKPRFGGAVTAAGSGSYTPGVSGRSGLMRPSRPFTGRHPRPAGAYTGQARALPGTSIDPAVFLQQGQSSDTTWKQQGQQGQWGQQGTNLQDDLDLDALDVNDLIDDPALGTVPRLDPMRVRRPAGVSLRPTVRPVAGKKIVIRPTTARVPTDPEKLCKAIESVRKQLDRAKSATPSAGTTRTETRRGVSTQVTTGRVTAEQIAARIATLTGKLDAHLAVAKELLKKTGLTDEQKAMLQKALGAEVEETKPEGEQQVQPEGEAKPEGETAEPEGKGVVGWLWPTEKPWYKRPAMWLALVGGVVVLMPKGEE